MSVECADDALCDYFYFILLCRYVNSWRATGDHHDDWSSTASIIEQLADIGPYGGPGGWNASGHAIEDREKVAEAKTE